MSSLSRSAAQTQAVPVSIYSSPSPIGLSDASHIPQMGLSSTSLPAPAPTFPLDTPLDWKCHPSSLSCSWSPDRTCWSFLFGMVYEIRPGMEPICHHHMTQNYFGQDPCLYQVSTLALLALAIDTPPGIGPRTKGAIQKGKCNGSASIQLPVS